MRILITGASGFVGPHLAAELLAHGHEVLATGRSVDPPPGIGMAAWKPADLTSRDDVRDLLAAMKPECIVLLAAQSNPAASWDCPDETFRVNAAATALLADEAGRSKTTRRILFVSSSDVYGAPDPEHLPVRETSPFSPANPYAVSKVAAERLVALCASRHELEYAIVRPFSHTGPGQTERFVVPAFARQIARIEAGEQDELRHGSLGAWRDFSDVRDVVRAYRLAAESAPSGSVYNVCSGSGVSVQSILDRLVALSSVAVRTTIDKSRLRTEKPVEFRGDRSLIAAELGWQPEIPIERTLSDVLDDQRARSGAGTQRVRSGH